MGGRARPAVAAAAGGTAAAGAGGGGAAAPCRAVPAVGPQPGLTPVMGLVPDVAARLCLCSRPHRRRQGGPDPAARASACPRHKRLARQLLAGTRQLLRLHGALPLWLGAGLRLRGEAPQFERGSNPGNAGGEPAERDNEGRHILATPAMPALVWPSSSRLLAHISTRLCTQCPTVRVPEAAAAPAPHLQRLPACPFLASLPGPLGFCPATSACQ